MKTQERGEKGSEMKSWGKERFLAQAHFADLGKLQLGNQSVVLVSASLGNFLHIKCSGLSPYLLNQE